jgi:hypothetical protein
MKAQASLLSSTVCHPPATRKTITAPTCCDSCGSSHARTAEGNLFSILLSQQTPTRGWQGPGQQRLAPANISKGSRWRQTYKALCEQCLGPVSCCEPTWLLKQAAFSNLCTQT